MLHPVERSVLRTLRDLRGDATPWVVAVSGGPDSTALLAALRETRAGPLVVAHLDHGLRGAAARDRERAAVEALAARWGLPCERGAVDVLAERERRGGGSVEGIARALRYGFLGEVAARWKASWVAVGHTADDQAETVLLRLFRGSGLRGVGGMPARRRLSPERPQVGILRPLLACTRAQVLDYLEARGLPWIEDETNREACFLRNRIRHEVLPLLRDRVHPRVDEALLRLARQAREADEALAELARELLLAARAGEGWRAEVLAAARPAVRARALAILAERLAARAPGEVHVRALEALVQGRARGCQLPGGVALRVRHGQLECVPEREEEPAPRLRLPIPGSAVDRGAGLRFEARLAAPPAQLRCDPRTTAYLDAERVGERALTVRRRRPGDRFWPLGGPGHRSLKRFLQDQRVPPEQRDRIPVVCLGDRPLWVVGHRIDDAFKVTPATSRALELRARPVVGEQQ